VLCIYIIFIYSRRAIVASADRALGDRVGVQGWKFLNHVLGGTSYSFVQILAAGCIV